MTRPPALSLVVPAFNEEKRLPVSLARISEWVLSRSPQLSVEVLVVDDGSSDRTAAVAEKTAAGLGHAYRVLRLPRNRGKGAAVREGVLAAAGEQVLVTDADLSTPIEEVEKLLPHFQQGYDVVIASRSLKNSEILVRQPWHRQLMGKVFNRIVRLFAVPGIIDTQCGFKCFSRRAVEAIFPLCRVDGFAFDVEILYLARKLKLGVKEVPVRWIDSPRSTVSPLRDSARMFREVLALRWSDWRGAYRK